MPEWQPLNSDMFVKNTTNLSPASAGRLLVVLTAVGWGVGWPMMKTVMHDWPPLYDEDRDA
jgi:hypothetical protein